MGAIDGGASAVLETKLGFKVSVKKWILEMKGTIFSGTGLKNASSSNRGYGSNNSNYEFFIGKTLKLTLFHAVMYWHRCRLSFTSFSHECLITFKRKSKWVSIWA